MSDFTVLPDAAHVARQRVNAGEVLIAKIRGICSADQLRNAEAKLRAALPAGTGVFVHDEQLTLTLARFGMQPAEPQPAPTEAPPRIGEQWWGQGGIYAGVSRAADGDYHLILAQEQPSGRMNWTDAKAWAERVTLDGCRDFRLPDRRESALLFANLHDHFEEAWYWTGEQYSADDAWSQYFSNGNQYVYYKDYKGRARAVRRFLIP